MALYSTLDKQTIIYDYYNSTIIARKKKVQVSFDVLHALIILSFQVMHFMDNDSGKKKPAISEC